MLDALDQDYDLSPNKGVVDLEIRRVVTTSQVRFFPLKENQVTDRRSELRHFASFHISITERKKFGCDPTGNVRWNIYCFFIHQNDADSSRTGSVPFFVSVVKFYIATCYVQEEVLREEKEVIWEEVVCNTVEYEYEIRGSQRRLINERNIGQTVSVSVSNSKNLKQYRNPPAVLGFNLIYLIPDPEICPNFGS